jgi:hypothetical protein
VKIPKTYQGPTDAEHAAYLAECLRVNEASKAWEEQLRRERTQPVRPFPTEDEMINQRGQRTASVGKATVLHDGQQIPAIPQPERVMQRLPIDQSPQYQRPVVAPMMRPGQQGPINRALTPEEMMRAQGQYVLPKEGTPGLPVMPAFKPTGVPTTQTPLPFRTPDVSEE